MIFFFSKFVWKQKNFGPKIIFLDQKFLWTHNWNFSQAENLASFSLQCQSINSECVTPFKACWSKTFRPEINLALKIVSVKNGPKICFGSKEFRSKKVGLKNVWSKKYLSQKKIGQMIWTNVPRTNVAWTNVNVTAGICSRCSQEPTFKVSSKSGQ